MVHDKSQVEEAINQGHYRKKQLLSGSRLLAWSHGTRFRIAVDLALRFKPARMLDYGCGDGTFLAMYCLEATDAVRATGCDIDRKQVDDLRNRLGMLNGVDFCLVQQLSDESYTGAFDLLFCTEVLEHVVDPQAVIDDLHRLMSATGTLVVSVPVETGVPLLIKQAARHIWGMRSALQDYKGTSRYTASELVRSVLAASKPHIHRPIYVQGRDRFHDHKGFNWRYMRNLLSLRFDIGQCFGSPLRLLPPHLGSQAWFICRHRATSVDELRS